MGQTAPAEGHLAPVATGTTAPPHSIIQLELLDGAATAPAGSTLAAQAAQMLAPEHATRCPIAMVSYSVSLDRAIGATDGTT